MDSPLDALDQAIKHPDLGLRRRWLYYRGEQPRRWVTSKMAAIFGSLTDAMTENYCSLAVNSRVSRLEVTGWDGPGAADAQAVWEAGRWDVRQADLFRWGLAYGVAYLIAEDGDDGRVIAANRPTLMWHEAADDDPYRVEVAVKMWRSEGAWRATVYDDTDVYRYVSRGTSERPPTGASDFLPDPDDEGGPHGLAGNPVTAVYPFGLDAPCLLDVIAPIQDRINKISANKFVAAEFGAFRQRVFFTEQAVEDEDLQNRPDRAIILDPGDTGRQARVQELSATDLANYDNSLRREVEALFTLGLLPRHLMVNTGVSPSGEAIRADEGPLVEACVDHQREFGAALSHALDLFGVDAAPVWKSPAPEDDLSSATTVRTFVDAGVPWQDAVVRYAGWSDEDVEAAAPEVTPGTALPAAPVTAPNPAGAAILNLGQ